MPFVYIIPCFNVPYFSFCLNSIFHQLIKEKYKVDIFFYVDSRLQCFAFYFSFHLLKSFIFSSVGSVEYFYKNAFVYCNWCSCQDILSLLAEKNCQKNREGKKKNRRFIPEQYGMQRRETPLVFYYTVRVYMPHSIIKIARRRASTMVDKFSEVCIILFEMSLCLSFPHLTRFQLLRVLSGQCSFSCISFLLDFTEWDRCSDWTITV